MAQMSPANIGTPAMTPTTYPYFADLFTDIFSDQFGVEVVGGPTMTPATIRGATMSNA